MKLVAWGIRVLYWLCCLLPQRDEVVFLSRQSARPFDFVLLEPSLKKRLPGYAFHWECVSKIGKMDLGLVVRQVYHAARARLCLVDGYVPAVSVPRCHRALTIQVWHALNAIKKFGYQSLDTPAGRTSEQARTLSMHRGYDFIVAGMPGAVPFFAEAFDVDPGRIVPLGLPRVDYLIDESFAGRRASRAEAVQRQLDATLAEMGEAADAHRTVALYAPTFRKGGSDPQWLEHAVESLAKALVGTGAHLVVAGHPLQDACTACACGTPVTILKGISTIDALACADYVVTDYSTVAFEAGYAGKPVLFYVPDIEEYRASPGLNIDPLVELPSISSVSASDIARIVAGENLYDGAALHAFMGCQAHDVDGSAIMCIADFVVSHLDEKGN